MASEKTESKSAAKKRDERYKVVMAFTLDVMYSRTLTKERVEELMREHGVTDVDEPFDESGAATLYGASLEGNLAAVTALLEAGAAVDKAITDVDETPLSVAACNGHAECVIALISAGANVDKALTNGETPLWRAAWRGHVRCVQALMDAKADVDKAKTATSTSPLFMAAQEGHVSCVNALIDAKADVNKANNVKATPLHMAVQRGHASCVQALIEAGADLNAKSDTGATAVMTASFNKHVECVRLLIRAGAKVEATAEYQDGKKFSAVDVACGNATILNELRKICSRCKTGLKKRYFCSICSTVAYCSQECSDAAWPEHESKCGPCPRCDGCRWGMMNEAAIVECCTSKKAKAANGEDDKEKSEDKKGVRRYCNEDCRRLGWPKHKAECVECHGCRKSFASDTSVLKKCAACKTVHYCSVDCQRTGWKAGHKAECKKAAAATAGTTANKT